MATDTQNDSPLSGNGEHASVPVARRYTWLESSRLRTFESWEHEIAYAEDAGYKLAPPDYHIPHWSVAMSMGDALPKLYVMRTAGNFEELRTAFNCPVGEISYPLFFRRPA